MRTNEEWMKAYQSGDIRGLTVLYERLHETLYSFLYRYTREEQLSIDIVHDTFEVLQKKKHQYNQHKGSVKAYLFQIAYRLLINKLNRRKRWRSILPFLVPTPTPTFSTDDKLVIQQAISRLSEKHRAVILLAYYADLPQDEMAQILGVPIGTVKSRLYHAIKILKEQLKEDFNVKK